MLLQFPIDDHEHMKGDYLNVVNRLYGQSPQTIAEILLAQTLANADFENYHIPRAYEDYVRSMTTDKRQRVVDQYRRMCTAPNDTNHHRPSDLNVLKCMASIVRLTIYEHADRLNETKDLHATQDWHYEYVPYPIQRFARVMWQVLGWNPEHPQQPCSPTIKPGLSFIDVGAGIADKVLVAYALNLFDKVSGVEYTAHTYELSKHHLSWLLNRASSLMLPDRSRPQIELMQDDAFNISYEDYDVIYMFNPMSRVSKMKQLYAHIVSSMSVGAVLVEVMDMAFSEYIEEAGIPKGVAPYLGYKLICMTKDGPKWYPEGGKSRRG